MARSCCCRCVSSVSYRDRQLPRGGQSRGQRWERLRSEAGDGLPRIRLAQTAPGVSSLGGRWQRGGPQSRMSGKDCSSQPMARARPRLYLRLGHLPVVSGHPLATRDHLVPSSPVLHRSSPAAPAKSEPRAGYGGAAPRFRAAHTSRVLAPVGGGWTADRGTSAGAAGEVPSPEPQPQQLLREGLPKGRACSRSTRLSSAPGEERPPARPRPACASRAGDLSLARTVKTRAQKAAPLDQEHPESGQSLARCPVAPGRGHGAGDAGSPRLRSGGDAGLGMPVRPG